MTLACDGETNPDQDGGVTDGGRPEPDCEKDPDGEDPDGEDPDGDEDPDGEGVDESAGGFDDRLLPNLLTIVVPPPRRAPAPLTGGTDSGAEQIDDLRKMRWKQEGNT